MRPVIPFSRKWYDRSPPAGLNDDNGRDKRQKDMRQAETLMQAMIAKSQIGPLADAFVEAWQRGYSWRTAIAQSLAALPDAGDIKAKLAKA